MSALFAPWTSGRPEQLSTSAWTPSAVPMVTMAWEMVRSKSSQTMP